jgi:hypothetical protein
MIDFSVPRIKNKMSRYKNDRKQNCQYPDLFKETYHGNSKGKKSENKYGRIFIGKIIQE